MSMQLKQWCSYVFEIAYNKHLWICMKFQRPSKKQTWQDGRQV